MQKREFHWKCPHCGQENIDYYYITSWPKCKRCGRNTDWAEIMKKRYPMWQIEYENNVTFDGGFWEWWEVSDGSKTFKCNNHEDAEWLCGILNRLPISFLEEGGEK